MESKVPHSNGLKIIWMTESNVLLTIIPLNLNIKLQKDLYWVPYFS